MLKLGADFQYVPAFPERFQISWKDTDHLQAAARERAGTSSQPRKAAHANSLPLLLLPDCSARGKSKNAVGFHYSWTTETQNYRFQNVFNACGCLYVNNTWKQRDLMPAETPPREACQQKPPASTCTSRWNILHGAQGQHAGPGQPAPYPKS